MATEGCLWPPPGRALLWLVVSACGLALLGYCLYFDRKRRSSPDFKRRLREKRRKEQKKAKEREAELLEMKDAAKLQDFFLQEIQLGELWLAKGEPRKSIEHLINAISVCTQPGQLMQVLEQTLPPHVFEMLVNSIPYTIQSCLPQAHGNICRCRLHWVFGIAVKYHNSENEIGAEKTFCARAEDYAHVQDFGAGEIQEIWDTRQRLETDLNEQD